MDIIYFHSLDFQISQVGNFHLWRIFDIAGGLHDSAFYGEIGSENHRFEKVERKVSHLEAGLDAGKRFNEKICDAIDSAVPGVEDGRIKMERRGIDLVRLVEVADIICLKVQMALDKRSFVVLVDIGDVGIINDKSI